MGLGAAQRLGAVGAMGQGPQAASGLAEKLVFVPVRAALVMHVSACRALHISELEWGCMGDPDCMGCPVGLAAPGICFLHSASRPLRP